MKERTTKIEFRSGHTLINVCCVYDIYMWAVYLRGISNKHTIALKNHQQEVINKRKVS